VVCWGGGGLGCKKRGARVKLFKRLLTGPRGKGPSERRRVSQEEGVRLRSADLCFFAISRLREKGIRKAFREKFVASPIVPWGGGEGYLGKCISREKEGTKPKKQSFDDPCFRKGAKFTKAITQEIG